MKQGSYVGMLGAMFFFGIVGTLLDVTMRAKGWDNAAFAVVMTWGSLFGRYWCWWRKHGSDTETKEDAEVR